MQVLITRPLQQALAWVEHLRAYLPAAWALHAAPLIDIAPPVSTEPIAQAWLNLATYDLVLFVSVNAVEGFFSVRPHVPVAARSWPSTTWAGAPGPGTIERLSTQAIPMSQLLAPSAVSTQFDSEALWQVLQQRRPCWRGAQVLVVCGSDANGCRQGRSWLAQQLMLQGASISYVVTYQRRLPCLTPIQLDLLGQGWTQPQNYVWFFSSSEALANLRQLSEVENWPVASALPRYAVVTHPRIAQKAQQIGFNVVKCVRPAIEDVALALQPDLALPVLLSQSTSM